MILEEGNRPYPRFPKYCMLISQWSLNGRHASTSLWKRDEEREMRRLEEDEADVRAAIALTTYGFPLMEVFSFKCMWHILLELYDN